MSCKSTIAATTTITAYTPNLLQSAWQSDRTVVVPAGETTLALGYGIEVRWQSSDLSVFAGATRTGSAISSSTPSTPKPTPKPTPAMLNADTTTPAISPSTKLALGLGIPIVVILLGLILAALFLIRRRRHQKKNPKPYTAAAAATPPAPTPPPAELQGNDTPVLVEPKPLKVELNARTPSPVEIDGTRVVVDQRVSGTYTISPVGTHFAGHDDARMRRSPPSHHSRSGSGSVARTPSSVRRSSDDRMGGRRSAPTMTPVPVPAPVPILVRKGTTPESSASEEEREIAERYRMFTTS